VSWNDEDTVVPVVVDGEVVPAVPFGGPITFVPERDIWERHPDESDQQWAYFQQYRDMTAYDRSIGAVAEHFEGHVVGNLREIFHRFRWRERVAEYDRYQDSHFREALLAERIRTRKGMAGLGSVMRKKAANALKHVKETLETTTVDPETGEVHKEVKTVLTVKEILDLAKVGADLETTALDMKGEPIVARQINMYINDSDEEILEAARELLRIKGAKVIDHED